MNWHSFLFSERKTYRILRHLFFWVMWWIYFTASYYHYEQSGLQKIEFEPWGLPFCIRTMMLLTVHISSCYYFVNYLMPRYLFTAKYPALVVRVIILCVLIVLSSYCIYSIAVPFVNSLFHYRPLIGNQNIWWTSIAAGLLSAPKVILAAAAVKILKRWRLKQQEKARLEREKFVTELQLLKTQMHPDLLFSSLNNICVLTQKKVNEKAAMLLLKLADILSYMLYDCNQPLVPLEKEIKAIKDYLVLEKDRMGSRLEVDVAIKGDTGTKMIAPLLLFPFVENISSYAGRKSQETRWINLEFQIDDTQVVMKLIHGTTEISTALSNKEDAINKARKQLEYFYPGRHVLKTTVEPEITMTCLTVALDEQRGKNKNAKYVTEQITYDTV